MKQLLVFFLVLTVSVGQAQEISETKRAVATYTGSSTQGYYFTNDLNKNSMLFAKIEPGVLEEYDLSGSIFIRETFRIAYRVEKIKGKNRMTIISMELLDSDDEDEDDDGIDR